MSFDAILKKLTSLKLNLTFPSYREFKIMHSGILVKRFNVVNVSV